jgi:hypothetical protein
MEQRNGIMNTTVKAGRNDVRSLTADELSAVSGAIGEISVAASDSGTDAARRTITMFLRRVWRDGALFG